MKKILVLIKKDINETFKDKLSLLLLLAFPILIFPGLNILVDKVTAIQEETNENTLVKIGYISEKPDSKLVRFLNGKANVVLTKYTNEHKLISDVSSDSIDTGLVLDSNFEQDLQSLKSGKLNIYIKSTHEEVKSKVNEYALSFNKAMLEKRLDSLKMNHENINPTQLNFHDVASSNEKAARVLGALLPYLFIVFGFSACRITAVDLFTKEKEMGTIELLLTAPITKREILTAKLIVVVLAGMVSILLTIIGLVITFKFSNSIPKELASVTDHILQFKVIALTLLLSLPLALFFSGFIVPIAVSCNSYKQTESVINPILLIMMIPAMSGFFPNLELTFLTSLIPLVNISLLTRGIISGTIDYSLYATASLSMILLAFLGLVLSVYFFNKENKVLKV